MFWKPFYTLCPWVVDLIKSFCSHCQTSSGSMLSSSSLASTSAQIHPTANPRAKLCNVLYQTPDVVECASSDKPFKSRLRGEWCFKEKLCSAGLKCLEMDKIGTCASRRKVWRDLKGQWCESQGKTHEQSQRTSVVRKTTLVCGGPKQSCEAQVCFDACRGPVWFSNACKQPCWCLQLKNLSRDINGHMDGRSWINWFLQTCPALASEDRAP